MAVVDLFSDAALVLEGDRWPLGDVIVYCVIGTNFGERDGWDGGAIEARD